MRTFYLSTAAVVLLSAGACQTAKDQKNDPHVLSSQAIEIHDEIMPQIAKFDQRTVFIDSLLANLSTVSAAHNTLDSTVLRQELTDLKTDLNGATDKMMIWMKEYTPDSTNTDYQKAEIEKISTLKTEFDEITNNADRILMPFNK